VKAADRRQRIEESSHGRTGRRSVPVVLWLVFMSSLILCEAHAADPRLSHLMPPGGERGTEVEVTFRGQRSGQEPQGILFYEPGIECSHIEAVDENAALAKLKISADCRVGIHAFRLRTASGVSSLRTFLVGTMPVVQEVEPNNDFNSLQAISLDTTVHGVVTNEDVDYFVVEAKKGERLTVEIEGMRLGIPQAQSFFDPFVAILDEKRFELASCDDSPLLQQDGVCSILAPADGKYIVQVRETAYRGNASCRYRLHVGRFPRPLAVYPAGGQPGETLHVQWLGELSGDRREEVVLPAEERPDFALFSQEEARLAPSGNPFRVVDLQNVLETEPNNSIEEFNTFSAPAALNGIIAEAGGIDYFRFPATKGQVFDIRVFAREIGSPLDPVLHVFDAKGKSLAGNDDNGGKPDSYLRFTVPADGEYLVRIFDHLKGGGPTYTYRIELTHPKPHVELQLQERERLIATTIAVPQGNRTAVMLQATRRDFGGELTLSCEGFPAGVTADTIPILADQNLVPVVFSATSEAALAGALVAPRASPTKEGATLESHFKQRTWLLRGRNDVEVWSHYADRAAVVVTKKVPFSIDLVEPKVPLVRGGSMQLDSRSHVVQPTWRFLVAVYFHCQGGNGSSDSTDQRRQFSGPSLGYCGHGPSKRGGPSVGLHASDQARGGRAVCRIKIPQSGRRTGRVA